MKEFFIVKTTGLPILEQLRLEEALLRADDRNWCLVNHGSPDAIVMGISGKAEQLVEQEKQREKKVPLIKRFSGGGTVYIDQETLFVTFIGNESSTGIPALPREIMNWSAKIYQPFFAPHPFQLLENDYVMGGQKFGGNAQYVQKGRWLHHTSFLWDYQSQKMDLLKLPPKRPLYRKDRSHDHFLTSLNCFYQDKMLFIENLCAHLSSSLPATPLSLEETLLIQQRPHRIATSIV